MLIPHTDDLSPTSLARLLELDPCLEPEDLLQTLALADLMAAHSPAGAAHREGATWLHFGTAIRSARAEAGITRASGAAATEGLRWVHRLGERCALQDVEGELVDDGQRPDGRLEIQQRIQALRALVPQLHAREQYVLHAYYWDEQAHGALAADLGVAHNRLSQVHTCGLRALQVALTRAGW